MSDDADAAPATEDMQLGWSRLLLGLLTLRKHQVDQCEPVIASLNRNQMRLKNSVAEWDEKMVTKYRKLLSSAISQTQKENSLIQECLQQISSISPSLASSTTATATTQESRRKRVKLDPIQSSTAAVEQSSAATGASSSSSSINEMIRAGRLVAVRYTAITASTFTTSGSSGGVNKKNNTASSNNNSTNNNNNNNNNNNWILATLITDLPLPAVSSKSAVAGVAEVEHGETDTNSKDYKQRFQVPVKELIVLPIEQQKSARLLAAGSRVLARYPDTANFYPGTIVGNSSANYAVQFDEDDDGPPLAVPKHMVILQNDAIV